MALPGGSADKAGNKYESLWVVSDICQILLNDNMDTSIYFEKPDERNDGFEYIKSDSNTNYCIQVKNKNIYWTISKLYTDNVLKNFIKRLDSDKKAKCVFLSSSNTELDEITKRAQKANSKDMFFKHMISAKNLEKIVLKLKENICLIKKNDFNTDENDIDDYIFQFLRRIEIKIKDESSLKSDCLNFINCIFSSENADDIFNAIYFFSQEKYNEKFTKKELYQYFIEEKQFCFCNLNLNKSLITKICEHNDNFIQDTNSFYEKHKIVRNEVSDICNSITSLNKKYFFVVGGAGVGKSIILKEVLKNLKKRSWKILPIDIRCYDNLNSCEELGEHIYNKRISPVDVLVNLSQGKPALIILDQLDSLSSVSGRNTNKWNVIKQILLNSQKYTNIKVLIACRAFDLEKDIRLKEFSEKFEESICNFVINNLSKEAVYNALINIGVKENKINEHLIKLFSVPVHLQMLFEVLKNSKVKKDFNYENKLQLYDAFWNVKSDIVGSEKWDSIIKLMVDFLNTNKVLSAFIYIFDKYKDSLNLLLSNGVFSKNGQKISFFHESFYDYAFARILVANGNQSISDFILNSDQSLFIRSNVRQSLEFLRYFDTKRYIDELCKILNNENIRVHIKTLVLDMLLNFEELSDEEINVLVNVQGSVKDAILNKKEYKQAEFLIQYKTGVLIKNLVSSEIDKFNQSANLLIMFVDNYKDEAFSIIKNLDDNIIQRIILYSVSCQYPYLLSSSFLYQNARLYNAFKILLSKKLIDIEYLWQVLQYDMKDFVQPEQVFEIYSILIGVVITKTLNGKNKYYDFGILDTHEIALYIKNNPKLFLDINLPCLIEKIDSSNPKNGEGLIYDGFCSHRTYGAENKLTNAFSRAFNYFAQQNPKEYWAYTESYRNSKYESVLFFILKSLYFLPLNYSNKIIEYIIENPHLYQIGYASDAEYLTMKLIKKFTKKCSDVIFSKLIEHILNYKNEFEYNYFKKLKKRGKTDCCIIGHNQAKFIDSLDKKRLSKYPQVKLKLCELQRKFQMREFFKEPRGIEGGWLGSPIPYDIAQKMTLPQWQHAIYEYRSSESKDIASCLGGAIELSRIFERIITESPLKFINFIYELDISKTSYYYIHSILKGLKSLENHFEEKENIIKYCMSIDKKEFNLSIIDLLHSFISDNQVYLSKYCTDLIIKYVLNPEYNDEWEHKNIDLVYINCTNGQALLFLSEILKIDVSIKNKFNIIWDKVEKLTLASKIALINVLSTLYNSNKDFSLSLLKRIVFSDKKIVNSENFVNFIFSTAFLDNFNFYSDLLKKLDSNEKSVKVLISQMYVHYGLHLKQAQEMALKYIYSNDLDCRIGAAKVFSQYAQNENINKTSFFIENFDKLLNDEKDVVDACLKFLHEFNCFEEIFEFPLYKNIIESKGLRSCLHLLCKFKESPINKKYLNEYKYLIRKFLDLSKKSNLNCRESKEISELFEIILKVYEIQEDKEILDIIDEFLLTPVYSYRDKINNFERCI